jgi:hypothetical protein
MLTACCTVVAPTTFQGRTLPLRYIGLISVVVAALILGVASARAGDDPCAEPNDRGGNPCMLTPDTEVQGFLDAFEDRDVYAIDVDAAGGTLRVDMTPPGDYRVGLFRADGSEMVKPLGEGVAPRQFRVPAIANGRYYIQISSGMGDYSSNLPYKVSYTIEPIGSKQAVDSSLEIIQARPMDLVLTLGEAGKAAKKTKDSDGTSTTGPWYQVQYDRPRTFANERSGPLTIVEKMVLSPDVATAQKAFDELSAQDWPEASSKRKGIFLPNNNPDPLGDQFKMIGSCDDGCGDNTHFRMTVRYINAVYVLYTFGYSGEGGNNEAGAYLLGQMALQHLK